MNLLYYNGQTGQLIDSNSLPVNVSNFVPTGYTGADMRGCTPCQAKAAALARDLEKNGYKTYGGYGDSTMWTGAVLAAASAATSFLPGSALLTLFGQGVYDVVTGVSAALPADANIPQNSNELVEKARQDLYYGRISQTQFNNLICVLPDDGKSDIMASLRKTLSCGSSNIASIFDSAANVISSTGMLVAGAVALWYFWPTLVGTRGR